MEPDLAARVRVSESSSLLRYLFYRVFQLHTVISIAAHSELVPVGTEENHE